MISHIISLYSQHYKWSRTNATLSWQKFAYWEQKCLGTTAINLRHSDMQLSENIMHKATDQDTDSVMSDVRIFICLCVCIHF